MKIFKFEIVFRCFGGRVELLFLFFVFMVFINLIYIVKIMKIYLI